MSEDVLFAGQPFTEKLRQCIEKSYPSGTISFTHGREAQLEEGALYLVRTGEKAVVMPRMKYSESVEEVVRRRE